MTHLFAVLLCLLLSGCMTQPDTAPLEAVPETRAAPIRTTLYDPDHPMEKAYPGEIRAYPLTQRKVHGLRSLGTDVLILSGTGSTTLTVLTGEDLWEAATLTVDFELRQEDPSLQIHERSISFFDPVTQETVLLDTQLQELRRIASPQGLSGKPILSADTNTLYYCTSWSVVAWDLESGIRRTVKELSYSNQKLTALHQEDQILECTIQSENSTSILLLSSDDGRELEVLPEGACLKTEDSAYFATLHDGLQTLLLFSGKDASTKLLLPQRQPVEQYYLENGHAAITVCTSGGRIFLDCYDLNTGILRSGLILDELQTPKNIVSCEDYTSYILVYDPAADCDTLYRWDVLQQSAASSNGNGYVSAYHPADDPDLEMLKQCQKYADSIGEKFGITICVWENACQVQPWDYQFRPEHLAPVLEKELQLLEQRLSRYPEEILQQTAAHFSGLTICLVREITGIEKTGSLSTATGIQFFEENQAYVVIATGKYSEQALYHELYHVMETHILTESAALDPWEALNPAEFAYGSQQENAQIYLQGQTRAFVDHYSMRYLKEDRARIFEYAMLQGENGTFQSEYMQRKLTAVCQGIREAYKLTKQPEALPWEQYLVTPLTPEA